MIEEVESLMAGGLGPSGFLDRLGERVPAVEELASTPQDPIWHSEGNVRIHTEMVLDELIRDLPNHSELTSDERHALVLGAALHDIGKVWTTREKEIDGEIRIVSPHHAEMGRSYAALRLAGIEFLNEQVFTWTLGIVGYHHHPRKLISRDSSKGRFARIARSVPLHLLAIFERADIRGRVCPDPEEQQEIVDLFQVEGESLAVWEEDPYEGWEARIRSEFGIGAPGEARYVFEAARYLFERGVIGTLEEAIPMTHAQRSDHGRLILLCGPSGSGKSTWVSERLRREEASVVSLDDLRVEVSGKRHRQADNGKVLQLARERLKQSLRDKRCVIWDATNLRNDGRLALVDLAHRYGAASEIVSFATDPRELGRRNRKRQDPVPESVLQRQVDRLQWPELWEAQRVEFVR